jgi:hypothetical protein
MGATDELRKAGATDELRKAVVDGGSQEVVQLQYLIESCEQMQNEIREALVLMDEGYTMTTILSRRKTSGVIPRLTDALDRTNASRRIGRGAMIRLALAEGMTTKQLGERLGISRQLVERYRGER